MAKDLDPVEAFHILLRFSGDVERAAFALGVKTHELAGLSTKYGWAAKIKELTRAGSGDGAALQREINSAINLVQAHKLRGMVDRLVAVYASDENALKSLVEVTTKDRSYVDMTPLLKLVQAAEIAQSMTCTALGDSAEQKRIDGERNSGTGQQKIAQALARALDAADSVPGALSANIVRKELQG